ncbi:MAG: hypothetical protein MUC77_19570 [Chromatiaceae bacterium]|jgi:hypothetical protein|nr:hypothetical protein [Chromatiaceae bacterium]
MKDGMVKITIDIFSGRENPTVEFDGKELEDLRERLAPAGEAKRGAEVLPPMPTLGYRGLVVEQEGMPLEGLPPAFRIADGMALIGDKAARLTDVEVEDFVCGSVPREKIGVDLPLEIKRYRELRNYLLRDRVWIDQSKIPDIVFVKEDCSCAPVYEPNWWNVSSRQPYNNCYNYATNYRSDTFAQPGKAAGAMYGSLTCTAVKAGAVADELIATTSSRCPKEGHLVALVVAPGWDFHWYRKGKDRKWTHKPGGTPVTNLDNSGNVITDPRTADRGPYTDFCCFMIVQHGHIKIK